MAVDLQEGANMSEPLEFRICYNGEKCHLRFSGQGGCRHRYIHKKDDGCDKQCFLFGPDPMVLCVPFPKKWLVVEGKIKV